MTDEELMIQAKLAAKASYSPYSHFAVGAAVLTDGGTVYGGCNIENAAYSASICAERTAIFKAVSEGAKKLKAIAVYSEKALPCMPCGECRQVMAELGDPEMRLIFEDEKGNIIEYTLGQLMPYGFKPDFLHD